MVIEDSNSRNHIIREFSFTAKAPKTGFRRRDRLVQAVIYRQVDIGICLHPYKPMRLQYTLAIPTVSNQFSIFSDAVIYASHVF